MQFNSIIYAIFLVISFLLYWAIPARKVIWQNALLVVLGFIFYAWADVRISLLLAGYIAVSYFTGLFIDGSRSTKSKIAATVSVLACLVTLAFFKYYDFFVGAFSACLESCGFQPSLHALHILLPIGISFYTFQAISYTIDVYRGDIKSCKNIINYTAFLCFFPQLVAGPIERASGLLTQISKERTFDYEQALIGMRQILWGLLKKICVADFLASYVDNIMYNPVSQTAPSLLLASMLFLIQIYADFSAYSDIAIGSARLFGIRLSCNFRYPLFSDTIAEFWRRWHITLMNWLRDYVYIPLGGSRCTAIRHFLNILIVNALSGLWHGAGWQYVGWGVANGILMVLWLLLSKVSSWRTPKLLAICTTFVMASLCVCIFRSPNIYHAFEAFEVMFTTSWLHIPAGVSALPVVLAFLSLEFVGNHFNMEFPLERIKLPAVFQYLVIWAAIAYLIWQCGNNSVQFIYFQF